MLSCLLKVFKSKKVCFTQWNAQLSYVNPVENL